MFPFAKISYFSFMKYNFDYFKARLLNKIGLLQEEHQNSIEEVQEEINLPIEYTSRFSLYSVQSIEQILGREHELKLLKTAYDNWQITKDNLLITGELGSGVTSFLLSGTAYFPHAKVIESSTPVSNHKALVSILSEKLNIKEATKLTDIQKHILSSEEEHVIIFENIEHLFVRKIHGFTLLEDFLLFMHSTKEKIFWIGSISSYGLYYLDRVFSLSSNFNHVIHLKPISQQIITDLFFKRNEGYEIIYLKPKTPNTNLNNKLKNASSEEKQTILKNYYLTKLHDFSNGNISRALLFMKNSAIRLVDKNVYIKPFENTEIGDLSLDELFILEAVMQHGALSQKDIKDIFRNSSKSIRLSIENLLEKNLILISNQKEITINLLYHSDLKSLMHSILNRNFK
ncbi:hypothetical protein UJ101_02337 [Flavobacteriaceae bacterium UJ101]|nr:hypothetical protein UJ101_02337 [Flavobacteriaceae bacterium UJ101]